MKSIVCLLGLIVIAAAYPAQEGAAYTNEAIRQAQTSHLIPQNAQIQNVSRKKSLIKSWVCTASNTFSYQNSRRNSMWTQYLHWKSLRHFFASFILIPLKQVQEGIELAAYESIPGNQRVDLHQILRSEFPFEVVDNLQRQIDTIGRN